MVETIIITAAAPVVVVIKMVVIILLTEELVETVIEIVIIIYLKKETCESLNNNIFDCTSRKNIEVCTKTLKQITIHVGTEFGSHAEQIKYIIENFADPNLNKPNNIDSSDRTDKLKMFC